MTAFLKSGAHTLVKVPQQNDHQRYERKHQQRQADIHVQQDHERYDDLNPGNEKLLGAVVCEFRDIEQVAGQAGHQLADFCVVVVSERKVLEMVKEIPAHIGFDASAHKVAARLHIISAKRIDDPEEQIQQPKLQHPWDGERVRRNHGAVRDLAYDQRENDFTDSRQRGAEQVKYQCCFVAPEIGEKAFHQLADRHLSSGLLRHISPQKLRVMSYRA